MELNYTCPFCENDAQISCSYESCSDYYVDGYECGTCEKELDHEIIDDLAFKGVTEWMGEQIDRAEILCEDR